MRVICEFDMAMPGINDDTRREKSRVIEDENGVWRIQSKTREDRRIAELQGGQDKEGWIDEIRIQDNWPHGTKIGTLEYCEKALNMSSVLKAMFESGRSLGGQGMKTDLYTFVVGYKGGTYVSQVLADSPGWALIMWAMIGIEGIPGMNQKKRAKLVGMIAKNVFKDGEHPTPLEGLKNAWCADMTIGRDFASINICRTEKGGKP